MLIDKNRDYSLSVRRAIGIAMLVYNQQGYIKTSEPNANSKIIASLYPSVEVLFTPKELDNITELIDWVLESNYSTGPMLAAKALCEKGTCEDYHFGVLAYVPAAREYAIKQQARQHELASKGGYLGAIGQHISFLVKEARCLSTFEGTYGTSHMYEIISDSGYTLIWYSTARMPQVGLKYKATVKDYQKYNGVKQTIITRAKPE